MNGAEFTKWMKDNRVRVPEVATKTGLGSNTVYAFRRGEDVNDSTIKALRRFVEDYEASKIKAVS